MSFSSAFLQAPLQLVAFSPSDAILFGYLVPSFSWTGWKEMAAVFSVQYGVVHMLTSLRAPEPLYLASRLASDLVLRLLVNGAIVSAMFSAADVGVRLNASRVLSRKIKLRLEPRRKTGG